ncbi:MAG: IS6 family transposase [Acetobacteraceae bacterium]
MCRCWTFRMRKPRVGGSWRMDETYVRIRGQWKYLDRAADKAGNTIDFLLTAKRDRKAALRFLYKAIGQHGAPAKITIDKSGANAAAIESYDAGHDAEVALRQVKYLNNIVEQDHRAIKRQVRPMMGFKSNRRKLRQIRRREGRYLLRTNLTENDPALLWRYYTQLVAVEEAFKNLKGDLAIRPIFHQHERRVEAHIFIAFLAYCLQITLQRRLHALAPGLTARSALEKFAAVQMIDVHLPTADGREMLLTRYTQPEPELQLLIQQLKLSLPPQLPPRITAGRLASHPP